MDLAIEPEETVWLDGPAGRLEARWRQPSALVEEAPVALLCHPHPLFGGTLRNKTLYRISKRLAASLGIASLRFNFRGAGASEGRHDGGPGEVGDARAALRWLQEEHPASPRIAIGYSFGAVVGLAAAIEDPGVTHLIALGLPLGLEWSVDFLRETERPRLFVQGEHDEFGNRADLERFVAVLPGATAIHIVPRSTHLFPGQEDEAVDAVVEYLSRSL
jgi:alpha/beta superfamily hydrolase